MPGDPDYQRIRGWDENFPTTLPPADLRGAHLADASLRGAHLEGADLGEAHLEGKRLSAEELAVVRAIDPGFPERLPPADLRGAYLDAGTTLGDATLGTPWARRSPESGFVALADARWGNVNLAVVSWYRVPGRPPRARLRRVVLRDEQEARDAAQDRTTSPTARLAAFEAAARANRQLATVLRAQGLNDDADRFAYQAQILQRTVLRRQGRLGAWAFSLLLWGLAGYGHRLGRIALTYALVVGGFAAAYYALGAPPGEPQLTWTGALQLSMTNIHGRVFTGQFVLDSAQAWLAAIQAVLGIVVEGAFVAMLIQRFFGR